MSLSPASASDRVQDPAGPSARPIDEGDALAADLAALVELGLIELVVGREGEIRCALPDRLEEPCVGLR